MNQFNELTSLGGGQHTTTCRHTQHVSSGTGQHSHAGSEQSKSKRGGVCLTMLTSWILSTQLGQYILRQMILVRQKQLAVRGKLLKKLLIYPPQVLLKKLQVPMEKINTLLLRRNYLVTLIYQTLAMEHGYIINQKETVKKCVFHSNTVLNMVRMQIIRILLSMNAALNRTITDQNHTAFGCIVAQPSYVLGGVA